MALEGQRVSSKKPLQGSETETTELLLRKMTEINLIDMPSRLIYYCLYLFSLPKILLLGPSLVWYTAADCLSYNSMVTKFEGYQSKIVNKFVSVKIFNTLFRTAMNHILVAIFIFMYCFLGGKLMKKCSNADKTALIVCVFCVV